MALIEQAMPARSGMRVLVVAASKHGATAEVAARIAEVLRTAGHHARHESLPGAEPGDVDAVVIGSPVYVTRWLTAAQDFVATHREQLRGMPVWAFSCGLAGERAGMPTTAERRLLADIPLRGEAAFLGRLDLGTLGAAERTIVAVTGGQAGDLRPWPRIEQWAQDIATDIDRYARHRSGASAGSPANFAR